MAPATSSPSSQKLTSFIHRTHAPHHIRKKMFDSPPVKKYRSLEDIMARAKYAVVEKEDYGSLMCEQCGTGEQPEELLLCDKCDKGFHMKCVRPIVVRIPIGSWICPKCSGVKKVKSKWFSSSSSKRGFFIFLLSCFSHVITNVALFLWSFNVFQSSRKGEYLISLGFQGIYLILDGIILLLGVIYC